MNADEYWASEGVRFLNEDGTLPTVEERVKEGFKKGYAVGAVDSEVAKKAMDLWERIKELRKNAERIRGNCYEQLNKAESGVARIRHEANTWHQHYRDERKKAQSRNELGFKQHDEVSRLRELLNKLCYAIDQHVDFTDDTPEFLVLLEARRDAVSFLEQGANCLTAPAPVEPVTQDESSDAVRYADYILNHYDRNSEKDKLCLAKYLIRHGWNNGQPNAPAPEEFVTEKAPKVSVKEPAPEWRDLGPDEVIQEGDEYYTGKWTKITGWIGYPASNFAKVRTRRPLPKSEDLSETEPTEKRLEKSGGLNGDLPKQEEVCFHSVIADENGVKCTKCGKQFANSSKDSWLGDFQYSLLLCEDSGESSELLNCLRYLCDEIQKLKDAKTRPRGLGPF